MIWFTSDTHFGHKNIIKYCNRPFKDVEQMNRTLIENWNARVAEGDTVYFLGDFCFGNHEVYEAELNGNIMFIKGSHDPWLKQYPYLFPLKTKIDGEDKLIVLCHYAMRSWEKSHYGSWHLFGHHHGRLAPYGLSFEVGVECWNYAPVSLEKISARMKTLKPIVDYSKVRLT
jgi:calcineurin-like phosphoesterase family protein